MSRPNPDTMEGGYPNHSSYSRAAQQQQQGGGGPNSRGVGENILV